MYITLSQIGGEWGNEFKYICLNNNEKLYKSEPIHTPSVNTIQPMVELFSTHQALLS